MLRSISLAILVIGGIACAAKLTPDAAKAELKQLMTLYTDDRPKFVVQKQEIEQASDCSRAVALREAIDEMAKEAAMTPGDTMVITQVQMELVQAQQVCQAK